MDLTHRYLKCIYHILIDLNIYICTSMGTVNRPEQRYLKCIYHILIDLNIHICTSMGTVNGPNTHIFKMYLSYTYWPKYIYIYVHPWVQWMDLTHRYLKCIYHILIDLNIYICTSMGTVNGPNTQIFKMYLSYTYWPKYIYMYIHGYSEWT